MVLAAALGVGALLGSLATTSWAPHAEATVGVDDYPRMAVGSVDPWRFIAGYCTSFVAWRLNDDNHVAFTNGMGGGWFGNATTWADNARNLGYRVDGNPAVGAVAQWTGADMPSSGGLGHVAWVKQVNADGSVVVEEYNYFQRFTYDQRVTRAPRYIHLKDLGSIPPPSTAPPTTAPPTTSPVDPRKESAPVPVPFSTWAAFLWVQYRDAFGRGPTTDEFAFWDDRLGSGVEAPDDFTRQLIESGPKPGALGPVIRLYTAYFRRAPDSNGIAYWLGRYQFGMPLGDISSAFALSPEFLATYGNLGPAGFVSQLYANTMGRTPDPGGLAFWVDELVSGRRSPGDVVAAFSESDEFVFRSAPSTEVTVIYEAMLDRAPDPGGWAYWSAVLPTGPGTVPALIGAVRTSPEYRARAAA